MLSQRGEQLIGWVCVVALAIIVAVCIAQRSRHLFPVAGGRHRCKISAYPFRPGDVLLFSGSGRCGAIVSVTQKIIAGSPFTHTGLVFADPEDGGRLYVWEMHVEEATGEDREDRGRQQRGTRLANLVPHLEHYVESGGQVCVRSWNRPVDNDAIAGFIAGNIERTTYSYANMLMRSYARIFSALPTTGFTSKRIGRYCSELIAATLEHAGVLDFSGSELERRDVIPNDFAEETEMLPTVAGWRLGPEVIVE